VLTQASASPSSKGGAEPSGAKPKPLGGALCTLRADAHEWSQTHVTQIDIEADRGIKTQSAAEALLHGAPPPSPLTHDTRHVEHPGMTITHSLCCAPCEQS
jgi:hypothetical protein